MCNEPVGMSTDLANLQSWKDVWRKVVKVIEQGSATNRYLVSKLNIANEYIPAIHVNGKHHIRSSSQAI